MVPDLRARTAALLVVLSLAMAACGTPQGTTQKQPAGAEGEVPQLSVGTEVAGAGGGAAEGFGEEEVVTAEAAPEGLHITNVSISPVTPALQQAIDFTGFQSGGSGALIELPVFGVNPRLGMYYLIVPVINEGKDIVRNLEGRAEFFDARGRLVWTETQFLTHFPTRLQLNPPSLPNKAEKQPEFSKEASGYPLYYFPTNVGLFTFAVHDIEVAKRIKSWTLTFLVSQT